MKKHLISVKTLALVILMVVPLTILSGCGNSLVGEWQDITDGRGPFGDIVFYRDGTVRSNCWLDGYRWAIHGSLLEIYEPVEGANFHWSHWDGHFERIGRRLYLRGQHTHTRR